MKPPFRWRGRAEIISISAMSRPARAMGLLYSPQTQMDLHSKTMEPPVTTSSTASMIASWSMGRPCRAATISRPVSGSTPTPWAEIRRSWKVEMPTTTGSASAWGPAAPCLSASMPSISIRRQPFRPDGGTIWSSPPTGMVLNESTSMDSKSTAVPGTARWSPPPPGGSAASRIHLTGSLPGG